MVCHLLLTRFKAAYERPFDDRFGLRAVGDGVKHGTSMSMYDSLNTCIHWHVSTGMPIIILESYPWRWYLVKGSVSTKIKSRQLTRLDLLKELFNVYVNRLVSGLYYLIFRNCLGLTLLHRAPLIPRHLLS
jgi:hypothetical protein